MATTINQLNAIPNSAGMSAADLIPLYSQQNGDARKLSIANLQAYLQAHMTVGRPEFVTQYAAPSATGFTVAITDSSACTWLVLTPTVGFAAGTVTLPSVANAIDHQEILINCTQAVTTLTVSGNGATAVTGAPTTLSANGFFRMKYDAVSKTWYRVG